MQVPTRIALCAVWLLGAVAGAWALSNYENAPGAAGQTPPQWPAGARISRQQGRPVLLMFAHPQCPCTRASVAELNRLLTHCEGKIDARVLFIAPSTMPSDWTQTVLWNSTSAIPGVTVQADPDGAEAHRFGAESSGYVVVYDEHGKLRFKGGITRGRGEVGDNAGANVIISLANGRDAELKQTSVFGCGLEDKTVASNK